MTAVARQLKTSKEALSRLPKLDIRELREEWRFLYKTEASPHLSRELLIRAVAYRMQEIALGGLRPEPQPTAPDRTGAEANWSGSETFPPAAEARNSADTRVARANLRGRGPR